MKTMIKSLAVLALLTVAACGNKAGGGGGNADMAQPPCVQNPTTGVELLNACTTAQSGDPAKDAPYYPSLAPGGTLPALP